MKKIKISKLNKIMLILLFSTIIFNNYKKYNQKHQINKLFTITNSSTDDFSFKNKEYIDSIKFEVTQKIIFSNLYQKNNIPFIIDSLKNIPIKISEPIGKLIMSKTTAGVFICMDELSDVLTEINYLKNLKSNNKYIILINNRYLNDIYLDEIITHELYHYLDKLVYNISDTINKFQIVDKDLSNSDYLVSKVSFLYNIKKNNITPDLKKTILNLSDDVLSDKSYLSSEKEIFARWKTFKSKLVDLNYIKNINSNVYRYNITEYIETNKANTYDFELLLIIDLNKLELLNKITN